MFLEIRFFLEHFLRLTLVILRLAFTPVGTVRHVFISKITARFIAKDSCDVLAVLPSILGIHDTFLHVTFTAPPQLAISGGFLAARGSIETGMFIVTTNLHGNLALQTCVPNGTGTIHSHARLEFLFPRQQLRFVDARVRSELALAVVAFSLVETVKITGEIIGGPCGDW
jgi:hypothetical protein